MISATFQTDSDVHLPALCSDASTATCLSRYRLRRRIGQGGMGIVYLADDRVSTRSCAVKIMRPEMETDPVNTARFHYEIDVLARFSHPNIVRLIEKDRAEGDIRYFVMEYVDGQDLNDVVNENGPVASGRTVTIMRRICSALGEVHAHGIVHRDIKPANIVAENGNQGDAVKLVDFGLCQSVARQNACRESIAGVPFVGSPLYASPESYSGLVDSRSDIYSLGATAYHMLTGRPVFDERRPIAAIMAHSSRKPISVGRLCEGVHPLLETIVMKCLRKNPRQRFQSVEELDIALAGIDLGRYWRRRGRSSQFAAPSRGNRRLSTERDVAATHLV